MKKKRLGEILTERGKISAADLTNALQQQKEKSLHLGELLLQTGLISREDLLSTLVEVFRVEYVDCTRLQPAPDVLMLIPGELAKKFHAVPAARDGKTLTVVMAEPQNFRFIEELQFKTGLKIEPRLGLQGEIVASIDRLYAHLGGSDGAQAADSALGMEFISASSQERNIQAMREMQAELQQESKTTPAVQLVASIISAAVTKAASDIHIEPQQEETQVRFRVDGMMRDYQRIPRVLQHTVASRIKILSDMDIAERRIPQDGRFLVRIGKQRVDFRVSTLPTQYGEKIVLRLLESDAPQKALETLGFPAKIADGLRRILGLPQGMLLVTGPTGSGKSTTLYSCLSTIQHSNVNVVTVENPVEYVIPGLNQVQINPKAGLTFASCLRSVLRQDPDVVMLGEVRDKETAEIALKAAQTGHLVLSTLHTNDSVSTVTRLVDLGVPIYEISASLTAVIAQRLIRRLCSCHRSAIPTDSYLSSLAGLGVADLPVMQKLPNGCKECDFTGYRGRIGVYEMLSFSDSVRTAARAANRDEEIRLAASHEGMRAMQEHALDRVREGLTTLEEVERVLSLSVARQSEHCGLCSKELSAQFIFCPYCGERRGGRPIQMPLRKSGD